MSQALWENVEDRSMERVLGPWSVLTVATGRGNTETSLQGTSSVLYRREGASEVPDSARFSWIPHKVFPPSPRTSEDVFLSPNR